MRSKPRHDLGNTGVQYYLQKESFLLKHSRKSLIVVYQDKNTVSQKMCHAAKGFQRMGFLP